MGIILGGWKCSEFDYKDDYTYVLNGLSLEYETYILHTHIHTNTYSGGRVTSNQCLCAKGEITKMHCRPSKIVRLKEIITENSADSLTWCRDQKVLSTWGSSHWASEHLVKSMRMNYTWDSFNYMDHEGLIQLRAMQQSCFTEVLALIPGFKCIYLVFFCLLYGNLLYSFFLFPSGDFGIFTLSLDIWILWTI